MTRMLFVRKAKMAAMGVFLTGGMLFGSMCSMADLRHNFVAGTQAFVKGYATDLWGVLVPPAEDLAGGFDLFGD